MGDLRTEAQRRLWLALTDDWQGAGELAEAAGVSAHGAGTALLALVTQGLAERRATARRYEFRRARAA